MKQIRPILIAGVALLAGLFAAIPVQAGILSVAVPATGGACCIGYYPAGSISSYWAQTFVAPSSNLGQLTFQVLDNNSPLAPDPFAFIVRVIGLGSSGAMGAGPVLFSSPVISVSAPQLAPITVDLSNISFVPGDYYAFLLDTYATRGGTGFVGQMATSTPGQTDAYPEGAFYTQFASGQGLAADLASGTGRF